jgi:SAM-dependent methyltransferase
MQNVWGGGSGYGSNPVAAKPYMLFLQDFIKNNSIRSVVDMGCGDWQFSQFVDWGDSTYLGIDVVPSVIEANNHRFGRDNCSFICADMTADNDLQLSGDLLLVKDVLQHLSNANVLKILDISSRFKFSLITNAFSSENEDCENGDTRPLDIRKPPFNLQHAALVWAYAEKAIFLVTSNE